MKNIKLYNIPNEVNTVKKLANYIKKNIKNDGKFQVKIDEHIAFENFDTLPSSEKESKKEVFPIKCPDCGSRSVWNKDFTLNKEWRENELKERNRISKWDDLKDVVDDTAHKVEVDKIKEGFAFTDFIPATVRNDEVLLKAVDDAKRDNQFVYDGNFDTKDRHTAETATKLSNMN